MKYLTVMVMLLGLVGCGEIDPEYQVALNNYAKDQCNGKILSIDNWSFLTTSGYTCITDEGVEYREVNMRNIPVKYWEIE